MLDYGSGKGKQYKPMPIRIPTGQRFNSVSELWGVLSVSCYDPGYTPFSKLPTGKFDGVISTDVWEHCPEEDLPWIVEEIFSYAKKFIFANVACYPALKILPNGENAHCTIKPKEWWAEMLKEIATRHPDIRYHVILEWREMQPNGDAIIREELIEG
jgi:hypothetical protein